MNQTSWIGAFLVLGFVIYVITQNQLQKYLSIVGV